MFRLLAVSSLLLSSAFGCTNILVSKSAATAGTGTIIAYNADSGSLYGSLGHYPAMSHAGGAVREIWDWDRSVYLGSIPEAPYTYNVVGNANEHGLIIGETTFGGLPQLATQPGAIMDYGSLIWVTLQRARNASEAISVMAELTTQYGYASDGESFSIADREEVWLMELIGKGNHSKGAVWVASRVPEGSICATANQARTRTFALNDAANVRYAPDVVTFAQEVGLYPKDAPAEDFSFSDIYDPVSFIGARFCEARVWHIFRQAIGGSEGEAAMAPYLDYAQGINFTNRMPLFVSVGGASRLSVNKTMEIFRTHFEGTWFDSRGLEGERPDVGAGPGKSPYRQMPLIWKSGGRSFLNERTVGVSFTAWTFVAQSRDWMPPPLSALLWFSPDDSSTAVRVPLYGGVTKIPPSYGGLQGQEPAAAVPYAAAGDAYTMSFDSAFWVANMVANFVYGNRYREIMPIVQEKIHQTQNALLEQTAELDQVLKAKFEADPAAAVASATQFCVTAGEHQTKSWLSFWMFLFSRFRDGVTTVPGKLPVCKTGERQGCTARTVPAHTDAGYTPDWYKRIVSEGDNAKHYAYPDSEGDQTVADKHSAHKLMRMEKRWN